MRIIYLAELVPRLDEMIDFVKPKLPTQEFDVVVQYAHGNDKHTGDFNGTKFGRPTIRLLLDKPAEREREYPHYREYQKYVHVRTYFDKIDEETGEWGETYMRWKFPITKPLKQSGLARRLAVMNSENGKKSKGYLSCLLLSEEEWHVQILAHEFRHFWQWKNPGKRGRVWGARGQYSEVDADAYGIKMMRKWRREKGPREILDLAYNEFDGMQWELLEGWWGGAMEIDHSDS